MTQGLNIDKLRKIMVESYPDKVLRDLDGRTSSTKPTWSKKQQRNLSKSDHSLSKLLTDLMRMGNMRKTMTTTPTPSMTTTRMKTMAMKVITMVIMKKMKTK